MEAHLFTASWIFFAGWTAVLVGLCLVAFGRDLLDCRTSAAQVPQDTSRFSSTLRS